MGQGDNETGAAVRGELGFDWAAAEAGDLEADVESQVHSADTALVVGLVEAAEELRPMLRRDAMPRSRTARRICPIEVASSTSMGVSA